MRLVYLASVRMPTEKAHGYQIMKMCEAFAQANHNVELIVSRRKNLIKTDPFEYYGIKRNFRITRIWSLDLVNLIPKYGSWLSRLSFLLSAKIYLAFRGYDVLYIREHMSGLFFRDFILETHTLPREIKKRDLSVWGRARKIVVTTRFINERLAAAGMPADKIIVAPDAVDLKVFDLKMSKTEARQKLGLPVDKVILGYTGSLKTNEMEKGISTILHAMPLLSDKNVQFIAVGGLPRHIKEYKVLAESLGVKDWVEFRSRVGLSELAWYQKAFDVLLLSFPQNDHYAYFISPLKLFEYMASGRPIVASDLPSIREVLDEESAVFVEPDNAQSLARGIKKVLSDEKLGESISARARAKARKFTWDLRAASILAFIRDVQ